MQQFTLYIAIATLSVCQNSTEEPDNSSTYTASCETYQFMMNIEVDFARHCSVDTDCQQILLEGELECEANSLVANSTFHSEYFYELLEEADAAGCEIDIPLNQNCSATAVDCIAEQCTWQ